MVIDFHTHVFPENIAEKTISYLEEQGGCKAYTRGKLIDLKASMKAAEIDVSVVLPVVTKPSQFASVNRYAAEINGRNGIVSFGGIHPHTRDYKTELNTIKDLGLPGIKLHPDYQQTFIDDIKYIDIIQYAIELGLIISIHAGVDIGFPDEVHCMPQSALSMIQQVGKPEAKVVLAHTGGMACWDEVEEYLVGENIFMDISYTLGYIDEAQIVRIIRTHGADKILFATDSPWRGQKETLEYFQGLPLTEEEKNSILFENARKLLFL